MLEVVDTLMGHSLHSFDSDHLFLNTNPEDKRDRMLKANAVIQVSREQMVLCAFMVLAL